MKEETKGWRRQSKMVCVLMFLGALALLLIHLLMESASTGLSSAIYSHLVSSLFKEAAFALFIALALVLTIEKYTRERHDEEAETLVEKIKINLFEAVFKNRLPDPLYETVKKALLISRVVRRNFQGVYTISRLSDVHQGWVTVAVCHTYQLENISDSPIIGHKVSCSVDITDQPDLQKMCKIVRIMINGEPLQSDEVTSGIDTAGHFLRYSFKVNVPVGSLGIKIETEDLRVMRIADSNVMCSVLPTINMSVIVNTPGGDFSVEGEALHSEDLVQVNRGSDGRYSKMWELPYGIFPFQGIYFQWRPVYLPAMVGRGITVQSKGEK